MNEQQTTRAFYRHAESGQVIVVERRWDGTILGNCLATVPLKDLADYELSSDNNAWIESQNDKLILMS